MDHAELIKIVNQFALMVKSKYDDADIILFGSYAKGTNHKESDIDIAVILNDFENAINIRLELMRIRRKIDSRIEPHPFRLADFNRTNPLANEIITYGQRMNKEVS